MADTMIKVCSLICCSIACWAKLAYLNDVFTQTSKHTHTHTHTHTHSHTHTHTHTHIVRLLSVIGKGVKRI